MIHIATISWDTAAAILRGDAHVDMRFSPTRRHWHGRIAAGERVYYRTVDGSFVATAIIRRVHTYPINSQSDLDALQREFQRLVAPGSIGWDALAAGLTEALTEAQIGVAIWLGAPEGITYGPDTDCLETGQGQGTWCMQPDDTDVYPQCLRVPDSLNICQCVFVDPLLEIPPVNPSEPQSSRTAPRPQDAHTPPLHRSA